jgi:hypothetical protein
VTYGDEWDLVNIDHRGDNGDRRDDIASNLMLRSVASSDERGSSYANGCRSWCKNILDSAIADYEELVVNHEEVWRVYRDLDLTVKRTRCKRLKRTLRPRPLLSDPVRNGRLLGVRLAVGRNRSKPPLSLFLSM